MRTMLLEHQKLPELLEFLFRFHIITREEIREFLELPSNHSCLDEASQPTPLQVSGV